MWYWIALNIIMLVVYGLIRLEEKVNDGKR